MTGTVTLSVEVELGWGVHDLTRLGGRSEDGQAERRYLAELLELTEQRSVPITFDVVGHLFLQSCTGIHHGPHRAGWFDSDPGTDYLTDGLYYAPDVVSAIEATDADHEICTHTFSHALFDEVGRDVSDWELRRVQELHREQFGEPTTSLVPPRHQSPPYDVLRKHGIEVVRPPTVPRARTTAHKFKQLLAGPLPPSPLGVCEGIVETGCTTYPSLTAATLPSGCGVTHPVFRPLPTRVRRRLHLRKLKRATRTAARRDGHVHPWCHLFDLANDCQIGVVGDYLRWLDDYRQGSDLEVVTMDELPAYVDGSVGREPV